MSWISTRAFLILHTKKNAWKSNFSPFLSSPPSLLKSAGLGNSTFFCFPRDGAEVVQAFQSSTCYVIFLTRTTDNPYSIRKELRVWTTKIVIGHPVSPPRLRPARTVERSHCCRGRKVRYIVPRRLNIALFLCFLSSWYRYHQSNQVPT